MPTQSWRVCLVLALGLASGCGIGDCPPVSARALGQLPSKLTETGLFVPSGVPGEPRAVASNVQPYEPQFELWSDGATKRRWLQLPEGSKIDTSDIDDWYFPEGTKIWKEFARDGKVLETRLMYKAGPTEDDWALGAYVWNATQTEATLQIDGQDDVLGTSHDVPSGSACWGCHGGTRGRVLGVAAIQLSGARPTRGLSLAQLVDEERLSHPPTAPISLPGTALDQQALGYLHANCGSCHNQARPPAGELRCYDPRRDLDLSLRVGQLSHVRDTGAYRTALGKSLIPAEPDDSSLVTRCDRRYFRHMPPLGTEVVDEEGVGLLRRWVASLPAEAAQ